MPRDGSGVYNLPAGNPVVTNAIVASTWANSTMSDLAAQLNNVYTRDGLMGPTAAFKVVDGTVNAPGLVFNSEPASGWYRIGVGQLGVSIQGTLVEKRELAITTSLVPIAVPTPTEDAHAVTKAYVDTKFSGAAGGGFLPLGGGILTGQLRVVKNTLAPSGSMWNSTSALLETTDGVTFPSIGFHRSTAGLAASLYYENNVAGGFKWVGSDGVIRTLLDNTSSIPNAVNADTVDGYHAAVGNEANKAVVRAGDGYIHIGGFNLTGLTMYNESGWWRTPNPINTSGQVKCNDISMGGMHAYNSGGWWTFDQPIQSGSEIKGTYIRAHEGHIGGTIRDVAHCTLMMGGNRGCMAWEASKLIFGLDNVLYKEFYTFAYSDSRIKSEIKPTEVDALAAINSLDVIQYVIEPKLAKLLAEPEKHRIGLNADQIAKVIPEAVSIASDVGLEPNPIRPEKLKQLSYPELVPWIIKAIQQLSKERT